MSDLVRKYQHYFNESVKLQETVNEQLAYIAELEDAILSLDEAYRMTPARDAILKRERNKAEEDLVNSDDSLEDDSSMTNSNHVLAGKAFDRIYRINKIRNKTRNKTVQEEVLELDETSRELKLRYILKASGAEPSHNFSDNIPTAIRGLEDAAASHDEGARKHFQKMYNKRQSGIRLAANSFGKQDTVQDKKQ
jgi:hypothetical protein